MDKTGFFFLVREMEINRIMNSGKAYTRVHCTNQYLQHLRHGTHNADPEVRRSQVCSRGGTPIYGLYRYVPRNRVWFLRFLVLK